MKRVFGINDEQKMIKGPKKTTKTKNDEIEKIKTKLSTSRKNTINGYGKKIYKHGNVYEGYFKDGDRSGYGIIKYSGEDSGHVYKGSWKDYEKEGKGTYTWPSGDKYVGDWLNDKKHGYGVYTWANGDQYVGNWLKDSRHGYGKKTYKDFNWLLEKTGYWRNDKFLG